jgi:hypothetical protein
MVPKWSRVKSPPETRGARLALAGTVAGLALAGVCGVLPVAVAQAEVQAATQQAAGSCPATTLGQPFLKWGDANHYSLASGGAFEPGEVGWTLAGAAKTAPGSETFAVGGKLGTSSLDLPEGAGAQSPVTCVEPSDRTFRFFLRSETAAATVVVSVVYQSAAGNISIPVKALSVGSSWALSPALETGAARASAISGGVAHLSIRFAALKGTVRIDDVYLDPRMR